LNTSARRTVSSEAQQEIAVFSHPAALIDAFGALRTGFPRIPLIWYFLTRLSPPGEHTVVHEHREIVYSQVPFQDRFQIV
jgi:hypothetical protein